MGVMNSKMIWADRKRSNGVGNRRRVLILACFIIGVLFFAPAALADGSETKDMSSTAGAMEVPKSRYISHIIGGIEYAVDYDNVICLWVVEGEPLDPQILPMWISTSVGWVNGDTCVDFVDWLVKWDEQELEALEAGPLTGGAVLTLKGRWDQPWDEFLPNGTTTSAVTATTREQYGKTREPVCKIIVCAKTGLELPQLIQFYSKKQPEGVRVENGNSELISVSVEQVYPVDNTKHIIYARRVESADAGSGDIPAGGPPASSSTANGPAISGSAVSSSTTGGPATSGPAISGSAVSGPAAGVQGEGSETGTGEWSEIGQTWYGNGLFGSLATVVDAGLNDGVFLLIKQFRDTGWFEDDRVYEVQVETSVYTDSGGWEAYLSNIMTVDMSTDIEEEDDPGDGNTPPCDGSNSGKRGGGNRGDQEAGQAKRLPADQLSALAKVNPSGTTLVQSGIKVTLPPSLVKNWAEGETEIVVRCERKGEDSILFEIEKNGKALDEIGAPVCLRIPLKEEIALMKGISQKTAAVQLAARRDGVLISASYYDAAAEELVVKTSRTGSYEVVRGREKKFADTKGHWIGDISDFASARGLVDGYPDGTLRADRPVTEAELRILLHKAMGDSGNAPAPSHNPWSGDLAERELDRLGASRVITEVCGGVLTEKNTASGFSDTAELSPEDRECIQTVQRAGIMNGRGGGKFVPHGTMTRAEALAAAVNVLKN